MQSDEALVILEQLLPNHPLSNLQETVFNQVWEGKTYAEIAEICGYEHSYIRDVGFRLWQMLSEALGQKIFKSNIKAVLGRYARNYQATPLNRHKRPTTGTRSTLPLELEFPNGPVPLHSQLYIERPPIESQTFANITKPGSLIRLKASRQMGKTSLLRRIVAHAKEQQMQAIF